MESRWHRFKEWVRVWGGIVALVFSFSAWVVSSQLQAAEDRKAEKTCLAVNEGREDANRRLEHFHAMSDTLTDFLEGAAGSREESAAFLLAAEREQEASIDLRAAQKYREWSLDLHETEDLLQPYPLLEC